MCIRDRVITDPKAELYSDTAMLFKNNGYEVKVFNLVHPEPVSYTHLNVESVSIWYKAYD